jgi:glutathione peroxidase
MPCNQFGGQEPGTNLEIQAFIKAKGGKFPVFGKLEVNGPGTHPLYTFLKDTAPRFRLLIIKPVLLHCII